MSDRGWRSRLHTLAPFAAGVVLLLLAAAAWKLGWFERLRDVDALAEELRQEGWKGALLCIAAQFVQVVIFMIPGEITQVAAGYVFGLWVGFFYSVVGIMAGSACAYGLGKALGRPTFLKIFGEEALQRMVAAVNSERGVWGLFLLFLAPGAPKDAMSYGSGLAGVGLGRFLLVSGLGRLPALFFSTLFGAQAFERDWRSLLWTALVAGAAGLAFWLVRRRIMPS
ncbi:MAG: hypothetical protein GC160_19385 [Acidobacteria bacterium]|nr:hypothetical protein [Acidobacteriota bacterium]